MKPGVIAAAAAAVVTLACTAPRRDFSKAEGPEPELAGRGGFELAVHNRHFLDVNIFVHHDGQTSRLGTVTGSSSASLAVPAWMVGKGGTVRLAAEPVGETSRYVTDELILQEGQMVELNVESAIARSNYRVQ